MTFQFRMEMCSIFYLTCTITINCKGSRPLLRLKLVSTVPPDTHHTINPITYGHPFVWSYKQHKLPAPLGKNQPFVILHLTSKQLLSLPLCLIVIYLYIYIFKFIIPDFFIFLPDPRGAGLHLTFQFSYVRSFGASDLRSSP